MFQAKLVEKIKTRFVFSNFFFEKSFRLWDKLETYFRAGLATDVNMVQEYWMLDTEDYKHTISICNTNCSYTTTMFHNL